jgi:hypothetical protein
VDKRAKEEKMPEEKQYPSDEEIRQKEGSGEMTVREAGHLGGEKVRDLIEKGEEEEGKSGREAA